MDERIRLLAEQAGFTANDPNKVFLKVFESEMQKFAELLWAAARQQGYDEGWSAGEVAGYNSGYNDGVATACEN